jgi:type VI secretion system protein ImpL
MKQILMKLLKIGLIVTAVVLGLLIIFGLTLMFGWNWWVGFFILIGIVGLSLVGVILKKIWLKRREQQFVNQVIEQDNHYLKQMGSKEKETSQELQFKWKEAVDALKKSHLKKYGNPLYVLPWYMIIGESGSGKTTAIQSARLSSPFADVNRISGISGTRNCDWWFFEQAVLVDTAGRYAIPIDEGRDKEEWQKFLFLLTKYRKKEPLNGLVVSVAADKLLAPNPEILERDGKSIRRRIDELMLVLGAKFPVYLLVTKCDLVQGMNQFCNLLSEQTLKQAMGYINHDQTTDVGTFVIKALHTVGERLRNLRLLVFHKSTPAEASPDAPAEVDPGLLLFPEEFERLKPGLTAFIKGAFEENPYQETPVFRGIFFSSGRQEGTPYSHFLKELGLIAESDVLPGTNKGLFLHDLFSKILPKERELFTPTQRALSWNRLTKNLGLTAWISVGIAVCGLLSYAFVKNLWTLKDISSEFPSPPVLQGELLSDLTILERYRQAIESVSAKNRNWWIPRFGLGQSQEVEIRLKDDFCRRFSDFLLQDVDRKLATTVAEFSAATPHQVFSIYVPHLVRRVNLLRERLSGNDLEDLRTLPQPSYEVLANDSQHERIPEKVNERFKGLYLYYLVWQPHKNVINKELNNLQGWLTQIFKREDINLLWLTTWANQKSALKEVRLEHFWGGDDTVESKVFVPAAFTLEGNKAIETFIAEIEKSLSESLIFIPKKDAFKQWYHKAYFSSWEDFATQFSKGTDLLPDREGYRRMASRMATNQGPYFSFLNRLSEEVRPIADASNDTQLPGWVPLLFALQAAENQAATKEAARKDSLLAKTAAKGKSIIGKLEKKTGIIPGGETLLVQLEAGKAYHDYQIALTQLATATVTPEASFMMTTEIFKQNPVTGQTAFFKAQNAMNRLKAALPGVGSKQKIVWQLVNGPLKYYGDFVCRESACHLQDLWETEVLVELQGVSNLMSRSQLLFGSEGFAKKYAKGPAEPFISRSLKKGYYTKKILGFYIPFNKEFLSFLSRGERGSRPLKDIYFVKFIGEPTSANADARIQPRATRLELQCADETQRLINENFYVKKIFDWSPQKCGDVQFQILVGNLVLSRDYTGFRAFAKFLKEFSKGQRVFKPSDFPGQSAALKRLGIKNIKVKYKITGHKPVLKVLHTSPGRVPQTIAECWSR